MALIKTSFGPKPKTETVTVMGAFNQPIQATKSTYSIGGGFGGTRSVTTPIESGQRLQTPSTDLLPSAPVTDAKDSAGNLLGNETRYSSEEIDFIRSNYNKGKQGKVGPAAALLQPYRGYGGPRSTPVGDPNVMTASKLLLGA